MRYWRTKKLHDRLLVSLVAAAYFDGDSRSSAAVSCFVESIKAQTWPNWELLIVHDGPVTRDKKTAALVERITEDERVHLLQSPERKKKFGHPWRDFGISRTRGNYVGLTNADNYYVPTYFEWALDILEHKSADFVYCDMIHSHQFWKTFKTEPRKSRIDLGAWMARGDLVRSVRWPNDDFNADGQYIEKIVSKAKKVVKIPAVLFVHN